MQSATITILNNKKCEIEIDLPGVNLLYNTLKFKQDGAEFSPAFKRGWTGYTYLFNKKKNTFDLGLLSTVKELLTANEYTFEIKDNRSKVICEPLDISKRLEELKLIPRDHQTRILDLIPEHNKGIMKVATGGGKTLATALMTAKINKPTIILVIGLDLLNQFHELYSKIFDEEIGYIGNGTCNIQRINIASIWSLGSALNMKKVVDDDDLQKEKSFEPTQKEKIVKLLKDTELFILDECHVVTCDTLIEIYKHSNAPFFFGVSGTPTRGNESDLLSKAILGDTLIEVNAAELIEKGLLVKPIIKFIDIPEIMTFGMLNYQETYKQYIVENDVRNKIIVEQTKKLIEKGYTPLVLFKQISHGKILRDMLEEAGVSFEMLSGKDKLKVREEVKERLNKKEINCILASTIFDIGVDLPILNALVLSGGGKSSVRALQRVGRILRLYPNKKIAAVVEFYDQIKYLKGHSRERYKIYKREKGFEVIKSKLMK